MNTQTIAVLGGTGFVGSALVPRLARAGYRVRILTRYREAYRRLLVIPQVQIVNANVHDEEDLTHKIAGCDVVINLVAILNERGRDGKGFQKVHVELPRKIVAACKTQGVTRLLHVSALKADAENGPSHYLRTKGEGEQVIRRETVGAGIAFTIFQPSVIFGPDDSFINRFASMLRWPLPFFPLPRPNSRFAPVYVRDVANAMTQCLNDPSTFGKTYQLCGPQVFSLREIIDFIAATEGRKVRLVAMPDALSRFQAMVMDFVPGKPFSTDNYKSLTVNSICDANGFEKLGIKARSMQSVVPRYLTGRNERRRLDHMRRGGAGR